MEAAGDGVSAGFAGLLIEAVVRVGRERAALAGLKVHDVSAGHASVEGAGGLFGFLEHGEVDAEGGVGGFGAGDGLEDEIDGSAAAEGLDLRGDVGEDAALRGDAPGFADAVDQVEERDDGGGVVGDGVDADDGVARAEGEAVDDGGGDALEGIGGVVGLEAGGEAAGKAERVAKARDDADLGGDGDKVLEPHNL